MFGDEAGERGLGQLFKSPATATRAATTRAELAPAGTQVRVPKICMATCKSASQFTTLII